MFSQRNNPYCDLLQISKGKGKEKVRKDKFCRRKFIALEKNKKL